MLIALSVNKERFYLVILPLLRYHEKMKHIAKHVVRSYECDSYSHVNNAVYLNFLEYGRMEYLHAVGFDFKGVTAAGFYLYVTHIDIHYKASAVLDDELDISVESVKLGKISGTFEQVISKKDGTLCAEAMVSWACVNTDGRISKLPEEFMVSGLIPEK